MAPVTQTWQVKNNYTELNHGSSLKLSSALASKWWGNRRNWKVLYICFELLRLCSLYSTGLIKNLSKNLINRSYSSLSTEAVFANFCSYPKLSLSQKAVWKNCAACHCDVGIFLKVWHDKVAFVLLPIFPDQLNKTPHCSEPKSIKKLHFFLINTSCTAKILFSSTWSSSPVCPCNLFTQM